MTEISLVSGAESAAADERARAIEHVELYLEESPDVYLNSMAAAYGEVSIQAAKLMIEDPVTATQHLDEAHKAIYMAVADTPDTAVVDDSFSVLSPVSKWEVAVWLAKRHGSWVNRYDDDLAQATAQAQGDSDQMAGIAQAKLLLAIHANDVAYDLTRGVGLGADTADASVELQQAVENPGEDPFRQLDINRTALRKGLKVVPLDAVGRDIALLETSLRAGRYERAVADFETIICYSGADRGHQLKAASLMARYNVVGKKESLLASVRENLYLLEPHMQSAEPTPAERGQEYLRRSELLRETIIMADLLPDIRERAEALLICSMESHDLLPAHQKQKMAQRLQCAWTKWAHILPDDTRRKKWAKLATESGVDMNQRYETAW